MYNHYYNDLEGSNGKSLTKNNNNNNNEVTYRTARNFLALKKGFTGLSKNIAVCTMRVYVMLQCVPHVLN